MQNNDYRKVSVLIAGAGPAGLAAAIQLKTLRPQLDICVIEKAPDLGNHNLSGAVLEADALHALLDSALPEWKDSEPAKDILSKKVTKDSIMFLLGKKFSVNIFSIIKIASKLGLGPGKMIHRDDYVVSVSKLTVWLGHIARQLGVEVLTGFAADDIILDSAGKVTGLKLVDQGLDKEGHKQPNFVEGEIINADFVILAEGCDGLLTEKFVEKANLSRQHSQLFSVGIKEIIKVTPEQYAEFGDDRVVHSVGYPLWTPLIGPGIFGGGIMYPVSQDYIAIGMVVGADWKYYDFNPQDAVTRFKEHSFVKRFIEGGTVVEAGAKMIPEAGYYAIPRDAQTNSIGKANCLILGDSAGLVNVQKIKGLNNAIDSGIMAAKAIVSALDIPDNAAVKYTELLDQSKVGKEMKSARNSRQTVAKFGMFIGFPLSVLGELLPKFNAEKDYEAMTTRRYCLKPKQQYDKDTFTALAATHHREEQKFNSPCITFCPAGVYETISNKVKPANPSNCVHCKTCQRKCPFDNIRWTAPEGSGGPRYKRM
ncbi:MAG: 4Fe-4S dicluster domain-containing protein [Planctomycetota bacterium]